MFEFAKKHFNEKSRIFTDYSNIICEYAAYFFPSELIWQAILYD